MRGDPTGIYIHIPFCSKICHYCDFAKTSRYDNDLIARYFRALEVRLKRWLSQGDFGEEFVSLNFGGGTPSLFSHEYENIFAILRPHLKSQAEISLEANPEDINLNSLTTWKDLGFNRLSIGVQSFAREGLKALTRKHDPQHLQASLDLARAHFSNLNFDLIYGWQNQTLKDWKKDLETALRFDPTHLSLYNLTYAEKTPIGRKEARGKIQAASDILLEEMYEEARTLLAKAGFHHEEVSNWSKPGFSCLHNWLYWQGESYLGLGCGAHAYLKDEGIGKRFFYTQHLSSFCEVGNAEDSWKDPYLSLEARNSEDWLYEIVGSGLRSERGVDIIQIEKKTGLTFKPNHVIQYAINTKAAQIVNGRLLLSAKEWFRETTYCLALVTSFDRQTAGSKPPADLVQNGL